MMRVNYFFALIICYLMMFASLGQSPVADFSISSEVCLEEQLQIENLSQDASSFEWDFCEGDLSNTPVAGNITFLPGSFNPKDITLIRDDNDFWYGFVAVRSTNELYRLNFGTDPSNKIPQVDNLGSLNGALVNPEQVEFRKENGSYFGFVLNGGNETLLRLSFGNSLLNVPSTETVYSNIGTVNGGMDIAKNNGLWYAVFSHSTDRTIQILRIGNSLSGNPGVSDFLETPAIPGLIGADPIAIAEDMGMWYVFIGGSSSRTIHRVSFGSTLFNANPSSVIINSTSIGSSRPAGLEIARDQGNFIILVQLLDGRVQTWSLGSSLNNDVEQVNDFGNLGLLNNSDCIELVKNESEFTAFTMNSATRFVQSYTFPENCFSSASFTTDPTPAGIYYQQAGNFWVSLTAKNGDGVSYTAHQVTVKNSIAPDAGFSSIGNCSGDDINFLLNISNPSDSYLWDFGDGSQSTEIDPQHIYDAPGDYIVTLDIESADGCRNSSQRLISIFEPPLADFNEPVSACSNSLVFFQNLNTTDYKGLATYTWTVDGDTIAQSRDLTYTFPNAGDFEVSLIIEIPGCFAQEIRTVAVQAGPDPSFTVSDACVGTNLAFSNTTAGDVESFLWDFGDGTTSSQVNPVYTYSEPGDYLVTLRAFNAAGCESVFQQIVTVYSQPSAAFSNELACAASPVRFIDESVVQNANIETWLWDFGNGNTSTDPSPEFEFQQAGIFPVSLTVSSTFGCEATITQMIEVNASPTADFSFTTACVNETVFFTDESVPSAGETITAWAWNIGGEFSSRRNPEYTFDFATDYEVTLVVTGSNQCSGSVTQTVSLPQPPQLSFEVSAPCINNEVSFRDTSVPGDDPIVSRTWDFGGLGVSEGENTTFTFPRTGPFTVTLSVQTERGCSYEYAREIVIRDAPSASFQASTLTGAPPLEVLFTNNSSGADRYEWYVDGVLASEETDLTYTFEDFGDYAVELFAITTDECKDLFSETVSVVVPQADLSADGLLPVRSNGKIRLQLTVSNKGTINIREFPVKLVLEDGVNINAVVKANVNAGRQATIMLPFDLDDRDYSYICVVIGEEISGFPDVDLSNNSTCSTFSSSAQTSAPFPNPASDEISLQIYSGSPSDVSLELINSFGQLVNAPVLMTERSGIFTARIETAKLAQGTYLLIVRSGSRVSVHRIAVIR